MTPVRTVGRKILLRAPATMDPAQKLEFIRATIRADVVRVARELGLDEGEAPSAEQYHLYGRFGICKAMQQLGSIHDRQWSRAMDKLGLRHHRNHRATSEKDVLADINRVATQLGRPRMMPTTLEYAEHGKYSCGTVGNILAGGVQKWSEIARLCGLRYRHAKACPLTPEEMIQRYQDLCSAAGLKKGGRGVGQDKWMEATGLSTSPVRDRFGTWFEFVRRAGYTPRPPVWNGPRVTQQRKKAA